MIIPFSPPDLLPALPEIVLAVFGLLLLLLGVAGMRENDRRVSWLSVGAIVVAGAAVCALGGTPQTTFDGMFLSDSFTVFMKLLALSGSAVSIILAAGAGGGGGILRFEHPVLVLFSTLGMMLMISAGDLMSLYVGLELHSLPLYVLAALHRDDTRSTEAGLKYFVLGAISSGLLLYGMSLIYGYTGSTSYDFVDTAVKAGVPGRGVIFGVVLMLCGLAFKVSAVPFHMWAPDVYEGAPAPVTAFFAIAPKVAALAVLIRLLPGPFSSIAYEWRPFVEILAAASMAFGALAALPQANIKRLLAYSAIGNMGFVLLGLVTCTRVGLAGMLVYCAVYMVACAGAFAVVLMMKRGGRPVETIDDLKGFAATHPLPALAMAVVMFSMAGIPPLAGFFGKLMVFLAAVGMEFYWLAVVGAVSSVVAAVYHLRIVRIMYVDEVAETPLDRVSGLGPLSLVLGLSVFLLVFFVVAPAPLMEAAQTATSVLLPG